MGRKRKKKVKFNREEFIKCTVLVILFGIMLLAAFSPQSLSKIESTYGIKISDIIDYEGSVASTGLYENKINVETITSSEFAI